MMAEKARLFGDEACRAQIIDTASPADVKALGREVHGFDEERWVENRFEIAVRGNIAKFSQNPELRDWLVGTAPMVLVEASPVDTIWGIGLAADDKRASDPVKWRGLNLLGFALMKARDRLKLAALLLFLALHVLAVGTLVRLDVPELAFLALDGIEILPSSCGASFSLAMLPSFVGPTLSQPSHHGRFAAPTST
jgi:ribA/ribD-fused uncharacterized protein